MGDKRNIKLLIEYDGTDYRGWQIQPAGPTIQGEIEKALGRITGEKIRIFGAGRTDAGVHAMGQAAHFFTDSHLSSLRLRAALNGVLPSDIVIFSAEDVDSTFHARYSARSKRYRYTILNREVPSALCRHTTLFVPQTLDERAMGEAGKILVGTHDFSSFGCNAGRDDNPERTVLRIEVKRDGDFITVEIEAVSFLYKMARSIVGMLLEVGRGKMPLEGVTRILGARQRSAACVTAAPQGLCLVRVNYRALNGS
jgi:tRNA pseudouridine38-40 synthase